jgi:hypothetical protein
MMNFRFTISIEGLGARDVAEDNAEALSDAFERTHPEAGGAVGANLEDAILEVTFCTSGLSVNEATERAGRIFVDAAIASGLTPSPLVGFEIEADLSQPPRRIPLRKRRPDSWRIPEMVHSAG